MNSFLEILLFPGIIGIPLLDLTCSWGITFEHLCIRDHGSGTSTGEKVFVIIGAVLFYLFLLGACILIYWGIKEIRKRFF